MNEELLELEAKIKQKKEELKNVKGTDCDVYTRISGYHRAISNWNKGKMSEYRQRTPYSV